MARLRKRIRSHAEWVAALKPGDWTTDNKSALKRFSHSERFKKALELVNPKDGDKILDYGCSDGYLAELLNSTGLRLQIYGYDPLWSYYEVNKEFSNANRGISFTDNLDTFDKGTFNKITCLELLEHLEEHSRESALLNIQGLLAKNGIVIISVPIEIGFSSLLKNIVRIILSQTHENTNIVTIAKSFLMLPVKRRGDGSYILSHIRFDYRGLEHTFIDMDFKIVNRTFSPFSCLGPYINSQVFYVLQVLNNRTCGDR